MIIRRTFLCVLTVATVFLPHAIEGQQTGKVPRIGVLHIGTSQTPSTEAFRQGLMHSAQGSAQEGVTEGALLSK